MAVASGLLIGYCVMLLVTGTVLYMAAQVTR
jgi:DNA-directed RNA polymerase subunit RPC12/RpoP